MNGDGDMKCEWMGGKRVDIRANIEEGGRENKAKGVRNERHRQRRRARRRAKVWIYA
jgi:hypothetical protein